jgi:hypothetical protein
VVKIIPTKLQIMDDMENLTTVPEKTIPVL